MILAKDIQKYIPKLIDLTPIQVKLLKDWEHRFIFNPAGRRSRKTLLFSRKILIQALRNKNCRFVQAAPTNDQAKQIFWENLQTTTKAFWKRKPSEKELTVFLVNGSIIRVVGLDEPARIEGRPLHGIHITEMNNCKPDFWQRNLLPMLLDTNGFAYCDGVPEFGRDWYYDLCCHASGGTIPDRNELIKGAFAESGEEAFYHWFTKDVQDPVKVEAERSRMDDKSFKMEYEGSFEAFGGSAYYNFGKWNINDSIYYEPSQPVHIGVDFNVNPMTATHYQKHLVDGNECIFQIGESWLEHSNTPELGKELKKLYPPGMVTIYPDAAGNHQHTNIDYTDVQILRNFGFEVIHRLSNPKIKHRLAAVNSMLKNGEGVPRYFLNSKKCPHTMDDFNKVKRLDNGELDPKQKKTKYTHISDAAGYFIDYEYPVFGASFISS